MRIEEDAPHDIALMIYERASRCHGVTVPNIVPSFAGIECRRVIMTGIIQVKSFDSMHNYARYTV
jgi:hypothetical protein